MNGILKKKNVVSIICILIMYTCICLELIGQAVLVNSIKPIFIMIGVIFFLGGIITGFLFCVFRKILEKEVVKSEKRMLKDGLLFLCCVLDW